MTGRDILAAAIAEQRGEAPSEEEVDELLRVGRHAPMANRLPVGPGSRGGTYHLDRNGYDRAWRASHPEYRERERLRKARQRAADRGDDPADILVAASFPRPLPLSAVHCVCECGCGEHVVVVCGFCQSGMHAEQEAS